MSSPAPIHLDFVAHFASTTPEKCAVQDLAQGRALSYQELDEEIQRAAVVLRSILHEPAGQRVAVISRNRVEMLILHFACVRTGAIFVPINWRLAAGEVAYILKDCRPAIVLNEPDFEALLGDAGGYRLRISDSVDGLAARMAAARPIPSSRKSSLGADTPVTILYSSGTTGQPKGIIVTVMNAFAGSLNLALDMHCGADSVFLCDMPLFHTAGLFAAARTPLSVGATVLLSQKFDPAATYERLSDRSLGITHYFCVTQMAMSMRQLPGFDGCKLAHLTALITGGAPNPEAHVRRWLNDGVPMINGWGMSEIGSAAAQPLGNLQRLLDHASAIGFPHLTLDMKLVGSDGKEVATGEPGEIWVRGLSVTPGYWERPQLNAEAFSDGWFKTGDVAVRDADGFYTLVDRIKDMYISGGENVYPAEIEAVIVEMNGIADVAVVGVPDERWGEVGVVFVVFAPGASVDAQAVNAHCAARLAKYKLPRYIEVLDSLPRTPSGKVQKHLLRANWTRPPP
jgi:fatty-acyl-CoA synthase